MDLYSIIMLRSDIILYGDLAMSPCNNVDTAPTADVSDSYSSL
jgi:hypothetical protein